MNSAEKIIISLIMDERQEYELQRDLKRAKVDQAMQREHLEAEERLAHINASTAAEVARIQAQAKASMAA